MALDKVSLKAGIVKLLKDMETKTSDSKEEFASTLANLIDTYVKTATITVTVNTTGTATAQSGGGTGTIS